MCACVNLFTCVYAVCMCVCMHDFIMTMYIVLCTSIYGIVDPMTLYFLFL